MQPHGVGQGSSHTGPPHSRESCCNRSAEVCAPKLSPEFLSQVKRCFGPRERRPLATKDQKFASLTNDLFIFYDLTGAVARNSRPGGRVAPPGSHFPRKAMAHAEQPRACAPDQHCKQPQTLEAGREAQDTSQHRTPRCLQTCWHHPTYQQLRTHCRTRRPGARHARIPDLR